MVMPGAKSAIMRGAVEGDDLGAAVGEVVGEEAAACAEAVAGEVGVDVDFEDADFEDVAGFGFGDGDGASEDVAAGAAVGRGDAGVERGEPGGDLVGLDAFGWRRSGVPQVEAVCMMTVSPEWTVSTGLAWRSSSPRRPWWAWRGGCGWSGLGPGRGVAQRERRRGGVGWGA